MKKIILTIGAVLGLGSVYAQGISPSKVNAKAPAQTAPDSKGMPVPAVNSNSGKSNQNEGQVNSASSSKPGSAGKIGTSSTQSTSINKGASSGPNKSGQTQSTGTPKNGTIQKANTPTSGTAPASSGSTNKGN
jgi:hypothetical protein